MEPERPLRISFCVPPLTIPSCILPNVTHRGGKQNGREQQPPSLVEIQEEADSNWGACARAHRAPGLPSFTPPPPIPPERRYFISSAWGMHVTKDRRKAGQEVRVKLLFLGPVPCNCAIYFCAPAFVVQDGEAWRGISPPMRSGNASRNLYLCVLLYTHPPSFLRLPVTFPLYSPHIPLSLLCQKQRQE